MRAMTSRQANSPDLQSTIIRAGHAPTANRKEGNACHGQQDREGEREGGI